MKIERFIRALPNGNHLVEISNKAEVSNPILTVVRKTVCTEFRTDHQVPLIIKAKKGTKLTMLQCDPEPEDIRVVARENETGIAVWVSLKDVKPDKPFKGLTEKAGLEEEE